MTPMGCELSQDNKENRKLGRQGKVKGTAKPKLTGEKPAMQSLRKAIQAAGPGSLANKQKDVRLEAQRPEDRDPWTHVLSQTACFVVTTFLSHSRFLGSRGSMRSKDTHNTDLSPHCSLRTECVGGRKAPFNICYDFGQLPKLIC